MATSAPRSSAPLLLVCCVVAEFPRGHLQPFGSWADGTPIEERSEVPSPKEFFEISDSDGGHGRPVVFRGAASRMPAMQWDTDKYILDNFGDERIDGVEYNIKETRTGGKVENMNKMQDFLNAYNTSDIYMVSRVPKGMGAQAEILPCMRCGGFTQFLDTNNIWFSRGGSKSVVHYDDQDNINCMFVGHKRFVFMHPSYKKKFEANPNSKKNKFGWVDTDLDQRIPGYGAFMRVDVDRMDLVKYPGWSDVDFSYVDMNPGDCVYIPYQWYHQVTAKAERAINVHMWYWRPKVFQADLCAADQSSALTISDCSWGYEPAEGTGHYGVVPPKGKRRGEQAPMTKCRKKASKQKSGSKGEL
eukprot:TRINITY_DN19421_c0_g1_i1.p1 TRINITY_DN19421_c0_g1~~TRINITY_DN19421_c0_g1_i1.p1  ORF type:complete len:372 (-),score=69.80 TRINITY_DN19421_c0_g1_i1:378-1451(-)